MGNALYARNRLFSYGKMDLIENANRMKQEIQSRITPQPYEFCEQRIPDYTKRSSNSKLDDYLKWKGV